MYLNYDEYLCDLGNFSLRLFSPSYTSVLGGYWFNVVFIELKQTTHCFNDGTAKE